MVEDEEDNAEEGDNDTGRQCVSLSMTRRGVLACAGPMAQGMTQTDHNRHTHQEEKQTTNKQNNNKKKTKTIR